MALGVIAIGAILALAGGGYLVYAELARGGLGNLQATVPDEERDAWRAQGPQVPAGPLTGAEPDRAGQAAAASLFPAQWTSPRYWDSPEWAGSLPYGESPGVPDGFTILSASDIRQGVGAGGEARGLRIPALSINSSVNELAILHLEDSRAYETPNNTVGHIPETANPGQAARGWFFGHLESRIGGEGNVFRRLPEVPNMLRHGDVVDIFIETDEGEFLYRVFDTDQMHARELRIEDSDFAAITLVTCFPTLVYDHRLLVTAELLAFKPAGGGNA